MSREKEIFGLFSLVAQKLGLQSFFVETLDGGVDANYSPEGVVLRRYRATVAQTGNYGPWARPGVLPEADLALEELTSAPRVRVRWVSEDLQVVERVMENPFRG